MTTRAPFHSRPPNQPSSVSSGDVPGSQAADADRANSSDSTQTQAEYLESFKSGWRAFQSEVLDWRSRCSQAAGRMYTIAKPNHDLRQQLWAITKATKSICASLLNQGYDGFSSGSTTSNFVKTAFSLEGTKDKVGEMEAAKSILLSNDGPLEFDYPFRQERLEKELDSLTQEVNSLAERVAPWALDARGLSIGKQVDRTRSSSDVSRACLQYAEGNRKSGDTGKALSGELPDSAPRVVAFADTGIMTDATEGKVPAHITWELAKTELDFLLRNSPHSLGLP